MTKNITSSQWYVNDIINKIESKQIIRADCQRKGRWDFLPVSGSETKSNYHDYINFIYKNNDSGQNIILALTIIDNKKIYDIIDGSNRLNAIIEFIKIRLKYILNIWIVIKIYK